MNKKANRLPAPTTGPFLVVAPLKQTKLAQAVCKNCNGNIAPMVHTAFAFNPTAQ